MNLRNDQWMNAVAAMVLVILGVVIVAGVQGKHGTQQSSFLNPMGRAEDRSAQSDLRNALTAEKTAYADNQAYADSSATLHQIDTGLDWGGRLHVFVGASAGTPEQTVCIDETSPTGTTFSIADVAVGPYAGTYFGRSACTSMSPSALAALGSSWDATISASAGGDVSDNAHTHCATEGQTFETAVNAYRAQYGQWPAGGDVQSVTQVLIADQLLVATPHYASENASVSGDWSYNAAAHTVDTTSC
jgi:hypothetical protein